MSSEVTRNETVVVGGALVTNAKIEIERVAD